MPSIHFCPHCDNLLYPKVISFQGSQELIYACRTCGNEVALSGLGNDITIKRTMFRRLGTRDELLSKREIQQEILQDQTLPHVKTECPQCRGQDAVIIDPRSEKTMAVWLLCASPQKLIHSKGPSRSTSASTLVDVDSGTEFTLGCGFAWPLTAQEDYVELLQSRGQDLRLAATELEKQLKKQSVVTGLPEGELLLDITKNREDVE